MSAILAAAAPALAAPTRSNTVEVATPAAQATRAKPAATRQPGANEQLINGQLSNKNPKDQNDYRYQVHVIPLEAGKRYALIAESDDFDPMLRVSTADDNDEQLAEDDDGGDGDSAFIEFSPPRSGPYRIRVIGRDDNARGGYALWLRELPPLPPVLQPRPTATSTITVRSYSDILTEADAESKRHHFKDYLFHFEGGKPVYLSMDRAKNTALDPVLEVYAGASRGGQPIARNDDGGTDLNAFILFTPEESGDYIVRATCADSDLGSYVLRVGQ